MKIMRMKSISSYETANDIIQTNRIFLMIYSEWPYEWLFSQIMRLIISHFRFSNFPQLFYSKILE